jgi:hypothetical protein
MAGIKKRDQMVRGTGHALGGDGCRVQDAAKWWEGTPINHKWLKSDIGRSKIQGRGKTEKTTIAFAIVVTTRSGHRRLTGPFRSSSGEPGIYPITRTFCT